MISDPYESLNLLRLQDMNLQAHLDLPMLHKAEAMGVLDAQLLEDGLYQGFGLRVQVLAKAWISLNPKP